MKANRKFVEGDEAVSAVIGVILMVAITVAIAATVYVYVSGMIGVQQKVPTVQMLADEDDDRLSVINTDADVYWDNLAIRVTGAVNITVNGEVTLASGVGLTEDVYYVITDAMVNGGTNQTAFIADTYYQVANTMMDGLAHVLVRGSDFIDIEGTTADLADITVTIIHDDTDTTLGTYTYSSIALLAT